MRKMNATWKILKVSRGELQLGPTLAGGQSFRWKNVETDNWTGVFGKKVWFLRQEDDHLLYKAVGGESSNDSGKEEKDDVDSDRETENMLKSYLRLDVDLNHYYKIWSEADNYFRETAPKLLGVRILNQDVTENLFSFICSSNNNIKRITSMVENLCKLYGDEIAEVNKEIYRSFPTVEQLTGSTVEEDLREAGFGYRAKYVHQTACLVKKLGGSVWLESLKLLPYKEAKKELMKLPGVGPKVADCICLMSLGHMEAVPIDTHIYNVASKIYLPHLKKYKSVTNKVYNEIGDHFRSLHGSYAGWANTVLAKKGSSSEEDKNAVPVPVYPNVDTQQMFIVSGAKGNRKPNRYPRGRPFQQEMDGRSYYSQQPGMQQSPFGGQGGQRPFGQNSFSGYPSGNQRYPNSFGSSSNYPGMGVSGSSRPFYAGSGRPNRFNNRPGPGGPQMSAGGQFPGSQYPGGQMSAGGQFPGSQYPGGQMSAGGQFPGSQYPGGQMSAGGQFPGGPQMSAGGQFPGGPQMSAGGQFPGGPQMSAGGQFPGGPQMSAGGQFPGGPGGSQFSNGPRPGNSQFSASSKFPGQGQPSFNAQFPGSTFPMTS